MRVRAGISKSPMQPIPSCIFVSCFGSDGHHIAFLRLIIDYAYSQKIDSIVIGSSRSIAAFKKYYYSSSNKVSQFQIFDLPDSLDSASTSTFVGRLRTVRFEARSLRSAMCAYRQSHCSPPLLLIGGDIYMPLLPLFIPINTAVSLILIRPPIIARPSQCWRAAISLFKILSYSVILNYDARIKRFFCLESTKVSRFMSWLCFGKLRLLPDPILVDIDPHVSVSSDIETCFYEIMSCDKSFIFLFYGSIDPRKNLCLILDSILSHPRVASFAFVIAGKPSGDYLAQLSPIILKLRGKGAFVAIFPRYISPSDEHYLFSNSSTHLNYNVETHISSGVLHKALAYGLICYTTYECAEGNKVIDHELLNVCPISNLSSIDLDVRTQSESRNPFIEASASNELFSRVIIDNLVGLS